MVQEERGVMIRGMGLFVVGFFHCPSKFSHKAFGFFRRIDNFRKRVVFPGVAGELKIYAVLFGMFNPFFGFLMDAL